jgi:hypothetical protein
MRGIVHSHFRGVSGRAAAHFAGSWIEAPHDRQNSFTARAIRSIAASDSSG